MPRFDMQTRPTNNQTIYIVVIAGCVVYITLGNSLTQIVIIWETPVFATMSAKHFINDPTLLVNSALHALTITNPSIALDADNKTIYRRPGYPSQVSLVSGGGSGHEPSFGAFVGNGLLSAAVAGTIFASPSAEQIRKAIMSKVDAENGILVTVMNYTGDVLNFGIGVEKAKAAGLKAEMLVVGDDVGVGRLKAGKVGRRGIAGTVLVHKITGALAATGASIVDVYKVGKLTADNLVSVGASLDHGESPEFAKLSFVFAGNWPRAISELLQIFGSLVLEC